MNADLEYLVTLQAQDLELRRLRTELAGAPLRVAKALKARDKEEANVAEGSRALLKEETLRRSQELEIADRRGKIGRLRKQMEAATSAAQITALEHEIAFSEQAIVDAEDKEIASMERTEQYEIACDTATLMLEVTTATLAAERAYAADLTTSHKNAIAALEVERTATRALIDEARLGVYDRIAKAKGTGLSEAIDHKCAACQMMVRPQRWNDLTGRDHDETIFTCETCGRMLFFDPRRDAPVRWAAGEKLASANSDTARG